MELATIKTANLYDLALMSRKIVDLQKTEAVPPIIDAVSKVYYELGQNAPGNSPESQAKNIQLLAVSLWREVKEYFPFLRQEEIALAFKAGARGEYGDFFGINLITFHKWLKGYQMDAKRVEARRRVEDAKKVEYAPVMSKDEAEYEWKLTIQQQFANFKKTGHFICEFPTFQYQQFEKRGLINLSKERKKELYEQAKAEILEGLRIRRLNPKNKLELNALSDSIKRITEGKHSETDEKTILNHARRLALKDLYENIESIKL